MYRIYEIQTGDTLEKIASRLGINEEVLMTLNGLKPTTLLSPNSFIIIPAQNTPFDRYIIRKNDTIYSIARSYNIDPTQLLKLNGLNENDTIYPEEEIIIPKVDTGFYVTENGDTLAKISNALNLPIDEIARQNDNIYLLPDQLIVYKK